MDLNNTQFVFEGKLKRNLMIGMLLGVVCLAWTFIYDDEYHTRFWTNYLHNSVFFTGIAFTAMFFLSAQITAFAGWITTVRRIWEAMSQFMWVGLILLAVIVAGVWGHFHHLYHWNTPGLTEVDNPLYDKVISGKSGFLSPAFFTIGVLGFLGIWYFWAYKLRQASVLQDEHETPTFDYYKKQRKWAASFLPLGGFLSTVFLWEVMMSIDPHWYSTMFAWYSMVSMWLGGMALMMMIIIYLKSKGYLEYVTREHLHDLGKYLFGISVFWTYLWFDQFMLIWYANVGEETIYFKQRMNDYPVLFWANLAMNFVVPFLILMRNDTKRKFGTLFFVSLIIFFGHWWDFFYMIKPGARIAAQEAKEISEGKHQQHEAAPLSSAAHEAQPAEAAHGDATAEPKEATAAEPAAAATEAPNQVTDAAEATVEGTAATTGGAEASESPAESPHEDPHHVAESTPFRAGFTLPGLPELGIMLGFLSLFLFFFFGQLEKASLLPRKDPFLEESLHHATGAYIDEEADEHHDHH